MSSVKDFDQPYFISDEILYVISDFFVYGFFPGSLFSIISTYLSYVKDPVTIQLFDVDNGEELRERFFKIFLIIP